MFGDEVDQAPSWRTLSPHRAWSHLLWLILPVLLDVIYSPLEPVEPLALAEPWEQSHGWQCLGEADNCCLQGMCVRIQH